MVSFRCDTDSSNGEGFATAYASAIFDYVPAPSDAALLLHPLLLFVHHQCHTHVIDQGGLCYFKLRYTNATQYSTVMFHSTESLWLPTAATVLTPIMMVATAANGRSITQVATTDTNTSIVLSYLYSSPSTSFCHPLFFSSHSHHLQILCSRDPTTIWIHWMILLVIIMMMIRLSWCSYDHKPYFVGCLLWWCSFDHPDW